MLCGACETAFGERPEMKTYKDATVRVDWRRSSAISLLALARRRGRSLSPNSILGLSVSEAAARSNHCSC